MDIKDKILNRLAKQNMIKWQLDAFVKTHPALYKTIREAMEEYAGLRCKEEMKEHSKTHYSG